MGNSATSVPTLAVSPGSRSTVHSEKSKSLTQLCHALGSSRVINDKFSG